MRIKSKLIVFLKDVDLVATTAFLTLTNKMGYSNTLLALKRFDFFRFTIDCREGEEAENVAEELSGVLSSQSTFYNRNKHYFLLECGFEDQTKRKGKEVSLVERKLIEEIKKSFENKKDTDFNVHSDPKKVIFNKGSVFLAEVLVQEREPAEREALAGKLSADMAGRGVVFHDRGVMWWLVLRAEDEAQAGKVVDEIVVTVKRDRGLLLNPNYQEYRLTEVRKLVVARYV